MMTSLSRRCELSCVSQGEKNIDVLVVNPENRDKNTGLMLVIHGWGNNRYQYEDMMMDFSDRYNIICISPEYRGSGLDASEEGMGLRQPYDFSHLQVMDALASLNEVGLNNPDMNDKRTYVWGGSQGGHIALLAAEFAPHTFALIIDVCGIVCPTDYWWNSAGWRGVGDEFEIRDVRRFLANIRSKVFIFHGTKDELVDVKWSHELEAALKKLGKEVEAHYFSEADHFLMPTTTRMKATIDYASKDLLTRRLEGGNDFDQKQKTILSCTGADYVVDFSCRYPTIEREKK